MPTSTKERRYPVRDRSIRTEARILDAARSLLTRIPFEEVTTKRIAAEPGVSVGALYRFFPNRDSIIDTIIRDHIRTLRIRTADEVVRQGLRERNRTGFDLSVVLHGLIDVYVAYLDEHPDFRTISFGLDFRELSPQRGGATRSGLTAILYAFAFEHLYLAFTPEIDRKLRVAREAGECLMGYAYGQPTRERRDQVIAELEKMLETYLFPVLSARTQVSKPARSGAPD
jgi:AcrR family transcriptional regulator